MNTMMTTSLRKISVISMIIIIMNEFQFATTDGTKKTCKEWILNDEYKESFVDIKNSDRNHNYNMAKVRNDPDVNSDTSNISIFGLVYGLFIHTLNLKDVIKPSAFCKRIGVNSKHQVELATKETCYDCPGWIHYYGYSIKDGNENVNWKESRKLRIHTGVITLFQFMHGITENYLRFMKSCYYSHEAISVQSFCDAHFGFSLYPFKRGKVTRADALDQQLTSTITATASSPNIDEEYYSDSAVASPHNIYEGHYYDSETASSSNIHENLYSETAFARSHKIGEEHSSGSD